MPYAVAKSAGVPSTRSRPCVRRRLGTPEGYSAPRGNDVAVDQPCEKPACGNPEVSTEPMLVLARRRVSQSEWDSLQVGHARRTYVLVTSRCPQYPRDRIPSACCRPQRPQYQVETRHCASYSTRWDVAATRVR